MRDWLIGLAIAAACLIASWAGLLILARRPPSGILRDLAAFIPDCVTAVRILGYHAARRSPSPTRTPRRCWGASGGSPRTNARTASLDLVVHTSQPKNRGDLCPFRLSLQNNAQRLCKRLPPPEENGNKSGNCSVAVQRWLRYSRPPPSPTTRSAR